MKNSFIIYKSFYKPISRLSDEQLGRLFRALFAYQSGDDADVADDISMVFGFFVNQFEVDDVKYQEMVERNRENGRRGGAPKGNRNAAKRQPTASATTHSTQNKLNDNVNDNDNDNEDEDEIAGSRAATPSSTDEEQRVFSIEELRSRLLAESVWADAMMATFAMSRQEFCAAVERAASEWRLSGISCKTLLDAKQHCKNLVRKWQRIKQDEHDEKNERAGKLPKYDKRREAGATAATAEEFKARF